MILLEVLYLCMGAFLCLAFMFFRTNEKGRYNTRWGIIKAFVNEYNDNYIDWCIDAGRGFDGDYCVLYKIFTEY